MAARSLLQGWARPGHLASSRATLLHASDNGVRVWGTRRRGKQRQVGSHPFPGPTPSPQPPSNHPTHAQQLWSGDQEISDQIRAPTYGVLRFVTPGERPGVLAIEALDGVLQRLCQGSWVPAPVLVRRDHLPARRIRYHLGLGLVPGVGQTLDALDADEGGVVLQTAHLEGVLTLAVFGWVRAVEPNWVIATCRKWNFHPATAYVVVRVHILLKGGRGGEDKRRSRSACRRHQGQAGHHRPPSTHYESQTQLSRLPLHCYL